MRFGASLLLGLAMVAACGNQIDTSVPYEGGDAGAGLTDSGGSSGLLDANPKNEASVGDDDGAGPVTDASNDTKPTTWDADADADAEVQPPTCTAFTESFPNPTGAWKFSDQGWLEKPAEPPFFDVPTASSSYAAFQTSTAGGAPFPAYFLRHHLTDGCSVNLALDVKMLGVVPDTTTAQAEADVTFARVTLGGGDLDLVRTHAGVVTVSYAGGQSVTRGSFPADDQYHNIAVSIPANGGEVVVAVDGTAFLTPKYTIPAGPVHAQRIAVGIVSTTMSIADNVSFYIHVDNVVVSGN